MLFELVGTVMAGIAAALFIWALRRWKPGMPAWVLPVGAGSAMLAAAVSTEYGWYARIAGQLPETFVVAHRVDEQSPLRPWTFVLPFTSRFVAVDMGSLRTNPQAPGQRMLDLYFFGRWAPNQRRTVLWDCAGARTAALGDEAIFAADGQVADAAWEPISPDDPVFRTACAET